VELFQDGAVSIDARLGRRESRLGQKVKISVILAHCWRVGAAGWPLPQESRLRIVILSFL
jgi:hypothetical protein